MTKKFVVYEHHGEDVWVQKDLKGKHSEHCMCYSCKLFVPNTKANCPIAEENYALDKKYGITTPVWECPFFKVKDE